jgi:uncharacterized membrane protein YjfL (UPF0719 family)
MDMSADIARFLTSLGLTVLWSAISVLIVMAVFEVLNRRYHLMREVFEENSTAAAIFAGSFVLGVFYVVTQIVIH